MTTYQSRRMSGNYWMEWTDIEDGPVPAIADYLNWCQSNSFRPAEVTLPGGRVQWRIKPKPVTDRRRIVVEVEADAESHDSLHPPRGLREFMESHDWIVSIGRIVNEPVG